MDTPEPDDPFLIALTEEERLHGLDLFADEPPRTERPALDQTYEQVPAYAERTDPQEITCGRATPLVIPPEARSAPPVQPETWSAQIWQLPLVAAVLMAALVVFAVMTARMRTTTDGQLAALNDRIAKRTEAAHHVPGPAAGAAVPEPAAVAAVPEPAAVAVIPSRTGDTSAPNKVKKSASLRAPARSTPPTSSKPQAPPVRRDPPIQTASVSSRRTAEPVPIREPAGAPRLGSPPLPASLAVQPSPAVAVPATLARAEASAVPAPRVSAPETAIQSVLAQYRTAFRALDAGAARAVWPSVDAKALRKAFERLEEQDLTFSSCQIAFTGAIRAVAFCDGSARYVPRIGNKAPHDDQRQWEFTLSRVDDAWQIDTVFAR